MSNVREFQAQLKNLSKLTEEQISKVQRATGFVIYRQLLEDEKRGGTPVDTGYARASWFLSSGTPKAHLPAPKRDRKAKYSPPPNAATLSSVKVGEDIFITNAVPYIVFLNNGTQKLPGLHFIEHAVESATKQKVKYGEKIL